MGAVQLFILALAGISLCLSLYAVSRDKPLDWRFTPPVVVAAEGAPSFETVLDYTATEGQAHSPAIVIRDGGFDVLWFEGSEEAQADVDIHHAAIRRQGDGWEQFSSGEVLTRDGLGAVSDPRQIVVTLGNTIENEATGGLYATVASVGGWAMASVMDVETGHDGPVEARKLNLSPFLNRSHLVKSPMVAYADGSLALPAYFELGATHGVLVRLNDHGRVRDTRRIAGAGKPIQPMIAPLDDTRAVAFLRDFDPSGKLLISRTSDGGQSWSKVVPMEMGNPSSPVAAIGLGGGRILMAVNDDFDRADVLRLMLSEDEGETWHVREEFVGEDGALRYPMLRRLQSGEFVLTYSRGTKRGVVAHMFNQSWVDAQ